MKFSRYQHIERLGTDSVNGILDGECYLFPKIDGSNCQVWKEFPIGDPYIAAGNRNRQLTIEEDHAGFYEYISNHKGIQSLFIDNPDIKLYGEWLVKHTIKDYRSDAWRKFYVFDIVYVVDDEIRYYSYPNMKDLLDDYGIDYIPSLGKVKNPTMEFLTKLLDTNKFLMQDDKGPGEGIVIKNYLYKNRAGKQIWAKLVMNEFKDRHTKENKTRDISMPLYTEIRIVEKYLSTHLINKTFEKIKTDMGNWESRHIPRLLSTIWHDLIQEEMWYILKQFKNPTINFKELNRLMVQVIKETLPEVFKMKEED